MSESSPLLLGGRKSVVVDGIRPFSLCYMCDILTRFIVMLSSVCEGLLVPPWRQKQLHSLSREWCSRKIGLKLGGKGIGWRHKTQVSSWLGDLFCDLEFCILAGITPSPSTLRGMNKNGCVFKRPFESWNRDDKTQTDSALETDGNWDSASRVKERQNSVLSMCIHQIFFLNNC